VRAGGTNRPAPRPSRVIAVVAAAALGAIATGCGPSDAHRPAGPVVTVSVSGCGAGWPAGAAGPVRLVLENTDTRPGEVMIADARSAAVFADVEPLAPGTSRTVSLDLGAGRYDVRCAMEDEAMVTGPDVVLTGSARGTTPGVVPVSQGDLIEATKAYQVHVQHALPGVLALARRLQATIDTGDRSAARAAWHGAHAEYERLGAAYGAFGDLDTAINGLPFGLARGVADRSWSGFHRIEYGLWRGEPAASLRPVAARLVRDLTALQKQFTTAEIDPLDLSTRAHEITENTQQSELSGDDDFGAHAQLETAAANLDGTAVVLRLVDPLLRPRYAGLTALDQQQVRTRADLTRLRSKGSWPPLSSLPRTARERIDSDVAELAELLAPVAQMLEPRRTS
jgi:iron uptake system component EfeO